MKNTQPPATISKRTLHRLLHRGFTPEQVSWKIIPHRRNKSLRLSIIRRCEAILKSWRGSRIELEVR